MQIQLAEIQGTLQHIDLFKFNVLTKFLWKTIFASVMVIYDNDYHSL